MPHIGFKALRAGRTSNIERPTSNNVLCRFKKKTEQTYSTEAATKAGSESTLRDLSAFGEFCGLLILKSIKRSVINIQRSMFDIRCSTCPQCLETGVSPIQHSDLNIHGYTNPTHYAWQAGIHFFKSSEKPEFLFQLDLPAN